LTKRSSSIASGTTPPPGKKLRIASPDLGGNVAHDQNGGGAEASSSTPVSTTNAGAMAPPSSVNGNGDGNGNGISNSNATSGPSRPKRQVAMNRPDYHAMHHHIATPTAKWLDLIADPGKYNAVINEGELV
jgi:hypothetical protein